MNEMMERMFGTLRSLFGNDGGEVQVQCWVQGCKTPPAVVLAGTEDGLLAGCREHARRWVTSDACRDAAEIGGHYTIEALERWADDNGPDAPSLGSRPRNDVRLFHQPAANQQS